jgi:cobalt/nickel transport protein
LRIRAHRSFFIKPVWAHFPKDRHLIIDEEVVIVKKVFVVPFLALAVLVFGAVAAQAHFGMIIPSDQMVMSGESKTVHLNLKFWHPFEGQGMNLEKPAVFQVFNDGKAVDLLGSLKEKKDGEFLTWETDYKVGRPGLYAFAMEPTPYWEPAEDCFIVHYTKAYVAAFGDDEGWDEPLGLKIEIVPVSKPYGLYTGNVFQGQVLLKGKPVSGAEVEVEYYSEKGPGEAPSDYMVTQTIKADPNGIFTYAAPKAGWWGFAALVTDDKKMKHEGQDKDIEIGGVIWVRFHDMK